MEYASIKDVAGAFTHWVDRLPALGNKLFDDMDQNCFASDDCISACALLITGIDQGLGPSLAEEFVLSSVYAKLACAADCDWRAISRALQQRVSRHAKRPPFYQACDQKGAWRAVMGRLQQACSGAEVAVVFLRLAVRAACLDGSWFGPLNSLDALRQLDDAGAYTQLQQALVHCLALGERLAKQRNAMNIVDNVTHVCDPPFHATPTRDWPPWLRSALSRAYHKLHAAGCTHAWPSHGWCRARAHACHQPVDDACCWRRRSFTASASAAGTCRQCHPQACPGRWASSPLTLASQGS